MPENSEDLQIKLARKYLKMKIMEDNLTFRGHEQKRSHVYDLLKRTIEAGESNSALIMGPRGSGKSTLVNSVLHDLMDQPGFEEDSIVVRLNGFLHTDDKLALKSITTQMSLDNAIGDRVFGSFSENLAFLLSCLKSGRDKHCKSVLFFLDEFDMFCHTHSSQTLLYNLFDIAQSRQAPICVIGITCRLDVIELLEKRVKSRFSHRQIFIFPNSQYPEDENAFEHRIKLFTSLLSLPSEIKKPTADKNYRAKKSLNFETDSVSSESESVTSTKNKSVRKLKSKKEFKSNKIDDQSTPTKRSGIRSRQKKLVATLTDSDLEKETNDQDDDNDHLSDEYSLPHSILQKCHTSWKEFKDLDPIFVSFWNENVKSVGEDDKVKDVLQRLYDIDVNEKTFRNILFQLVCQLSNVHPQLEVSDVTEICQKAMGADDKHQILLSLSILELSLLITMKHQAEIFDNQPMNFEMIFNRYTKFVNSNSSSQSVPRAVILKAFEHLVSMELVTPMKGSCSIGDIATGQKEFQMFRPAVTPGQILTAVKNFRALPTELLQWANSSLI